MNRIFTFCMISDMLTSPFQECVSSRAKTVIGCEATSLDLIVGEPADFVIFDKVDAGWRNRKSIQEVVYDAGHSRQTVRRGRLISG